MSFYDTEITKPIDWNLRFLSLATHISTWSKDPSTKIGAVIVDPSTKKVISVGYNGFPRGVDDIKSRYEDREQKYKYVVHAEVNAVINAKTDISGCSIYVVPTICIPNVCSECAKVIIQSGIKTIYFYKPEKETAEYWQKLAEYSKNMLKESGISCIMVDRNTGSMEKIL